MTSVLEKLNQNELGAGLEVTSRLIEDLFVPGKPMLQALADARDLVRTASGERQIPWIASSYEGRFRMMPTEDFLQELSPQREGSIVGRAVEERAVEQDGNLGAVGEFAEFAEIS